MSNDQRVKLIESLRTKGISDEMVLQAMAKIPRELFVPEAVRAQAYLDQALPLHSNQTISQPFLVALMTELLHKRKSLNKVLEIGTGSGYQAAVLSFLARKVYSVERIESLYLQAKERLSRLKIRNVHVYFGDGSLGLEQYSPYDGIIVTAGAKEVPPALLQQLADKGRMVIPVNEGFGQMLELITRDEETYNIKKIEPVIFVPLLKGVVK